MNHQLSLDISLFLLHSLIFFFPSFYWVMSWSSTNEMKKTLSCSQYSHGLAQEGNTWTAHIQSLKIVIFVPGADIHFCHGSKTTEIREFLFLCYCEDSDNAKTLMPVLLSVLSLPHSLIQLKGLSLSITHRFSEYPKCEASKYLA